MCKLSNHVTLSITRSQIEILPNFAMTDYASQGKTRTFNVVDLSLCRSHQAYYTALSRSASAQGTIILQHFDVSKIKGKASGAMRQEFRELELLDEITKLHYIDKLPIPLINETRLSLIQQYRLHKGHTYVPSSVHPSLKWTSSDPMLDPIQPCIPPIPFKQKHPFSMPSTTSPSLLKPPVNIHPQDPSISLPTLSPTAKRKLDATPIPDLPPKKPCHSLQETAPSPASLI